MGQAPVEEKHGDGIEKTADKQYLLGFVRWRGKARRKESVYIFKGIKVGITCQNFTYIKSDVEKLKVFNMILT